MADNEVYIDTRLRGIKDVEKDIVKLENKLVSLANKMERFEDLDGDVNSKAYKSMLYDFEKMEATLEELNREKSWFVEKGFGTQESKNIKYYHEACVKASKSVKALGNNVKKTNSLFSKSAKKVLFYVIGIRSLYTSIQKLKQIITEGLQNLALFNGGANNTNKALSDLKSSLLYLKNSLATAFSPILEIAAPALTWLIDKLSQAMSVIGQFFSALSGSKTFTKAVKTQEDYAKSLGKTSKNAKEAKKQLSGLDKLNVINSSEKGDNAETGGIDTNKMFEVVEIENKIAEAGQKILAAFQPVKDFFTENIQPAFLTAIEKGLSLVGKVADTVRPGLQKIWERVIKPMGEFAGTIFLEFLDDCGNLFSDLEKVITEKAGKIGNILDGLSKIAEALWVYGFKPALQFISGAFLSFMSYIDNIVGDLIDIFDGLIDFLVGMFTGNWEKAWNGIKKIFAGVFNFIIDVYEGVVNAIIDGLNKISITVPDWVPEFGGTTFGFNLERLDMSKYKIPALATGTVVPRTSNEFLAKLGDNKQETEVVSPLSTMKQALLEALNERGSDNGDIIVEIDGYEVFRAVRSQAKRYTNMTGARAF